MKGQTIVAAVLAIGITLVAVVVVSGGKFPYVPGLTQNVAEVTVKVSRDWLGTASLQIMGVDVWTGIPFSVGPLWFNVEGTIQVASVYQGAILDSRSIGVSVGINETQTHILKVGMGDHRSGVVIKARLLDSDGMVVLEKSYTIP